MIIDQQRRLFEVGRIRLGATVPTGKGKTRPIKLESFRLTSPDKQRIMSASGLWGGQVEPWESPTGQQWQVTLDATELDVILPPGDMALSQYYELWSGGGCQRRCDGVTELLSGEPCKCAAEGKERKCKPTTRLSVMIRDLPGLGLWRVDTHSEYAAIELPASMHVIAAAANAGVMLPARLRLVQRTQKKVVDGKSVTYRFAVPVLDVDVTPGQLLGGVKGSLPDSTGPVGHLTPVPETKVLARPVAAQIAEPLQPRKGSKPSIMVEDGDDLFEGATVVEEKGTEPVVVEADETVWSDLAETLEQGPPTKEQTVPVIEKRVRQLFALMGDVGLWTTGPSGIDALHMVLGKRNAAHLGDLNKSALLVFCEQAWEAAKTKMLEVEE